MNKPDLNSPVLLTRLFWATVVSLLLCYAAMALKTAWVTDDAYITFRTIDNFLQGHGLRWNVAERVQTFTHPLWLLLLTPVVAIARELYLTSIVVSIVCGLAAFYFVVGRLSRSLIGAVTGGNLLLLSPSFISFTTSGLENALSYLLVALFLWILFRFEAGKRRSFLLGLMVSLAGVNRLDLLLMLTPALAVDVFRNRHYRATAFGFLPLILWLVFSVVYYGFPFPNAAYAKLSTGLGRLVYLEQGKYYMFDAFYRDSLTLVSIVLIALTSLFVKSWERRAVASGLLIYLLYVVWVGGDFMRGRFLTVPLVGAVGLLLEADLFTKRRFRFAVLPAVILLAMQNPVPGILSGQDSFNRVNKTMYHGITDERLYYREHGGLFSGQPLSQQVGHDMRALRQRQSKENTRVRYALTAGVPGLNAGPGTYLIDRWALGDALLARLPITGDRWRIGHFPRVPPAGYVLSLVTDENHVRDEKIHAYYDHLRRITRGPVFNPSRLKSIIAINLGRYDGLVRDHEGYSTIDKREYSEIVEADLDACGPRILWGAARQFLFRMDFDSAAPVLERLSQLEIARSDEYIKGAVQIGTNNVSVAPEFSEKLLKLMRRLEPDSPETAYGLGFVLWETGRTEEARPLFEEAATKGHPASIRWLERHQTD